jgi:hypothetical protein
LLAIDKSYFQNCLPIVIEPRVPIMHNRKYVLGDENLAAEKVLRCARNAKNVVEGYPSAVLGDGG